MRSEFTSPSLVPLSICLSNTSLFCGLTSSFFLCFDLVVLPTFFFNFTIYTFGFGASTTSMVSTMMSGLLILISSGVCSSDICKCGITVESLMLLGFLLTMIFSISSSTPTANCSSCFCSQFSVLIPPWTVICSYLSYMVFSISCLFFGVIKSFLLIKSINSSQLSFCLPLRLHWLAYKV